MVRVRHDERADEVTDGTKLLSSTAAMRREVVGTSGGVVVLSSTASYGEGAPVWRRRSSTAEHAHVSIRHGHDGRSGPALVTVALVVRNPRIDRLPLKRGRRITCAVILNWLCRIVPRLVAVPGPFEHVLSTVTYRPGVTVSLDSK